MREKRERIVIYDCIRILATLLVVIGHASYISHSTMYGAVVYELPSSINSHYQYDFIPEAIRAIGTWAYSFHMPLFFILSGAVYALGESVSFDRLAIKKAKTCIVPYYIYGLLFMLPLKWITGFYSNADMKSVLKDFMSGGPENGHLWFFITLFWCFIIGYVLLKYIGDKSLIAVLLIAILLRETDVSLFPAFMGFSNALTYLVWFVAGYIYEKKVRSRSADTGTGTHAIAFLILTAIMIFFTLFVKSGSSVDIAVRCFWFVEGCECISRLIDGRAGIVRFLGWLAPLCVYIYIFHDPMEYVILKLAFTNDWLSNGMLVYVYYLLRTLGVITVSLLLGVIIVRIKKLLFRREKTI